MCPLEVENELLVAVVVYYVFVAALVDFYLVVSWQVARTRYAASVLLPIVARKIFALVYAVSVVAALRAVLEFPQSPRARALFYVVP